MPGGAPMSIELAMSVSMPGCHMKSMVSPVDLCKMLLSRDRS